MPELLGARLGGVPNRLRTAVALTLGAVVVVGALAAVRGSASSISGGAGGISFSFSYSRLRREATPAGQFALLASHAGDRLVAEIEVGPLSLPPHSGNVTGIEPVVAANFMGAFVARTPGVVLQSAGPTLVNGTAGYNFTYTRTIDARSYFGRVIFLTPSVADGRRGVTVSLLAQPVLSGIVGPGKSALAGALHEPGQGGVGVLFQPAGLLSLPLATLRVSG